jgi:hypothetical protein
VGIQHHLQAPMGSYGGSFDRDVLIIPEVMLEKPDCKPVDIRPMLDAVWNATGMIASPNFDAAGEWRPQR